MSLHIITLRSPDQWETTQFEAEQRLGYSLSEYDPFFIHWNDVVMLPEDKQKLKIAEITKRIKTGRKNMYVVVTEVDRNFLSFTESSPALQTLKRLIIQNSMSQLS